MLTLGEILRLQATKHPDRDAIVYPRKEQQWSYREFNETVNRCAHALADLGIEKRDVVSSLLHNTSEIVVAYLSTAKLGAVFNPLNYRLGPDEVTYILDDAKSDLLIYENETANVVDRARSGLGSVHEYVQVDTADADAHGFYELLDDQPRTEPATDVADDDVNIIMYTSGTTGEPKGVVHVHRDQVMQNWGTMYEMDLEPSDVGLSMAPLYHSAELHAFFLPRIHSGGTTVIQYAFDAAKTLELIEKYGVTWTFGAPTMWSQLIRADTNDFETSSLETGIYAGSTISPTTVESINSAFGLDLVNYYGMTELGPCATVSFAAEQREKPGCAGEAVLNHEVRIVDFEDGEAGSPDEVVEWSEIGYVIMRGPTIMTEYLHKTEQTRNALRDGWYYTGDLGYRDEDGAVWIVDRADDMIISGAENIYPREVENVLMEHPEVIECAVIGKPDEEWGEIVFAYVVTEGTVTTENLDSYFKENDTLADFKRPRGYEIVDEMPTTASGKIQKYKLRERVS